MNFSGKGSYKRSLSRWQMLLARPDAPDDRTKIRSGIALADIASAIWKGKVLIVLAAVFSLALSGVWVARTGQRFQAVAEIMPAVVDVDASASRSIVLPVLGPKAGTPIPKFQQFTEAIYSIPVAGELDLKENMLCKVYSDECNLKTGKWTRPDTFRNRLIDYAKRLLAMPARTSDARTAADLAAYITDAVTITETKSGVNKLTFSAKDPEFATYFLTSLIHTADEYIKDQDKDSLSKYVKYLSDRMRDVTTLQQRDTFNQLYLEQERRLMLTAVDVPYAAAILAQPNAVPISPISKLVLGTLLGVLATMILCIILFTPVHYEIIDYGNE